MNAALYGKAFEDMIKFLDMRRLFWITQVGKDDTGKKKKSEESRVKQCYAIRWIKGPNAPL